MNGSLVLQGELAALLGVTQSQLSRIETGYTAVHDLRKLTLYADAIGLPGELRWFDRGPEEPASAAPCDELRQLQRTSGEDDAVRRRDLLTVGGLAAATVATAPWDRLAHALAHPAALDHTTVGVLEDRTAALFRQEELVPARQLESTVYAHLNLLRRLANDAPSSPFSIRLTQTLGETEALAGWVAFDLGRHGEAQRRFLASIRAAEEAGDGPLRACTLGYMSYLAEAQGDPDESLRLLEAAQQDCTGPSSATTRAWLAGREAEVAGALGASEHAVRALERAFTAFDYASPRTERTWTCFFDAARLGSLAVTTYVRLNHALVDTTAQAVLQSLAPSDEKVAAIIHADLATAAASSGDYGRASALVIEAAEITNRLEASLARQRLADMSALVGAERPRAARELREQLAALRP